MFVCLFVVGLEPPRYRSRQLADDHSELPLAEQSRPVRPPPKDPQVAAPATPRAPEWMQSWGKHLRPFSGKRAKHELLLVPPNLHGLLHLPSNVRHGCVSDEAGIPLCATRRRQGTASRDYTRDPTGGGVMCGKCVREALNELAIPDADEYVSGVCAS